MFINVMQILLLIAFIASSVYVIYEDRHNAYGVVVNENGKKIISGKVGVQTTFGRLSDNDVVCKNSNVSRKEMIFTYDGESVSPDDYCKDKCNIGDGYALGNKRYTFLKPDGLIKPNLIYLPVIISVVFTALRYISVMQEYKAFLIIIPFVVLILYQLVSVFLVVNTAPFVECTASIMLTFYVYAMLYKSTSETLHKSVVRACLGVSLYVFMALAVKLIIMFVPLSNTISSRLLPKSKLMARLSITTINDILMFIAAVMILLLIVFNLVFAPSVNGARNWVYIGSLSIQPSEIIKVLFLFILVIPSNKRFFDKANVLYLLVIPAICFIYCLLIRDTGALIEYGIIWVLAVVLQSSSFPIAFLVVSGMLFGIKLVLKISSTAAQRFNGWISDTILDSLSGKGIFSNIDTVGYQPSNVLMAFKNGGAFGMKYKDVDVMRYIEASDSDLVMSILAQRYGVFLVFSLLFAFGVVILACVLTLRKQTKSQQLLTVLSISLLLIAIMLNLGGSTGVLPLTGVVFPFLSMGITSSISYGAILGLITSFSRNAYSIVRINKPVQKSDTPFKSLITKINN